MSSKDRRVISAKVVKNTTIIKYSDGSEGTYYHQDNKSQGVSKSQPVKPTSSTKNSGYTGYHFQSQSNKPTKAFEAYDIEFWGTPKHQLNNITFAEGDLIINCTGAEWKPTLPPKPRPFAKKKPDWLKISPDVLVSKTKKHNNGELAEQILFDWADMRPPPESATLDFWSSLIDQMRDNGVKRVFVCCAAGQGRTGTTLASLSLAAGIFDEPDVAIDYIRDEYNKKAIETKGQEEYVFGLVYEEV